MSRPCRSVLYIPGSKERALEKACTLPCDAIIFDLEDAVAPDEKAHARDLLARALRDFDYGGRLRIVRINGFDTEWGRADAAAMSTAIAGGARIDAVLVPKVNRAADLDTVAALLPGADLWAMMETAAGMLNAAEIAAHPRLKGMVMGTNDLARELNSRFRADRLPMQAGLGLCLLAAKAHGKLIIDGVYNAFKDEEGLWAECHQGRDMGFDGKTLIHPAQLAVANTAFAPSEAEIDLARRQIAAYQAAVAEGRGVAVLDGRIVENLHVATARATLARAEAIAALAD
ncbi:HpcH/HpaI aldolase/citrate lyase family protein [Fuscovulum blasticum]|uniref:HpcH/HpaI aldolase/citrate lyase family protein n=1 Tax=Fuscovulum blasticum TaxID=1075 RepID=UPI000D3EAD7A|nr:CoA ester lyase [Fuscovulum blasticum]AWD21557.1 CoA ester lyase [Fuscovulum blasticum]